MLLAIDAGNTNIVFALFEGDTLRHSWRCRTDAARTSDEYRSWLYPLFAQAGLEFAAVTGAIIGSVVPAANESLRQLCQAAFKAAPVMASARNAGLKIRLPRPEEIGADRLVNAAAVIKDYRCPAVVVDFGTATTFDVINGAGEYCGGVIAPGPYLSADALYRAAAKLPRIEIERPATVIGTDTVGAMRSGLFWGYAGMIEGLLARIAAEMGEKPFVLATGGLADLYSGAVAAIEKVDHDLTLRGLHHIYKSLDN